MWVSVVIVGCFLLVMTPIGRVRLMALLSLLALFK